MTANHHNPLLLFTTIIISVAALCHGKPVLDTDGCEVELSTNYEGPSYTIRNAAPIGFHGGLERLPKNECENYVCEGPEVSPGAPVYISPRTSVERSVQLGSRYKFSFFYSGIKLCNGVWTTGEKMNDGETNFTPIISGEFANPSSSDQRWFEVRSTEEVGVYKMAVCPCEFCELYCPEVGSYVVNGTIILGVGGGPYTVRFTKVESIVMKTAPLEIPAFA